MRPAYFRGLLVTKVTTDAMSPMKTYPLRVDDSKYVLEWRGKNYSLTVQPNCAKYGWHAEGNGASFDFCIATQGYGAIENKDEVRVQCDLKK